MGALADLRGKVEKLEKELGDQKTTCRGLREDLDALKRVRVSEREEVLRGIIERLEETGLQDIRAILETRISELLKEKLPEVLRNMREGDFTDWLDEMIDLSDLTARIAEQYADLIFKDSDTRKDVVASVGEHLAEELDYADVSERVAEYVMENARVEVSLK